MSANVKIFCACMLIMPLVYSVAWCIYFGMFSVAQFFLLFTRPAVLVYAILYAGLSVFSMVYPDRTYVSYDGTKESAERINKFFDAQAYGYIFYLTINGVLFPFVLGTAAKSLGLSTYSVPAFIGMLVGAIFLVGLSFYVQWLEHLEAWLKFVPFKKENLKFTIISRLLLTNTFTTLGLFSMVVAPLFMPSQGVKDITQLFSSAMLPQIIIGIILNALGFFSMARGITYRVNLISNFSQSLAAGDYTVKPLETISRDDFGVLVGHLNDFYTTTQSLLQDVQESSRVTREVGVQIDKRMRESSEAVNVIVKNIENVRTQMNSQALGVEEASDAASSILSSIESLNKSIEVQAAGVEQSSAAVREMVANIQSVTSVLEKNGIAVNQLDAASREGNRRVQESAAMAEKILDE